MAKHEFTSRDLASLGSRAMRNPNTLSLDEIKSLGGCVVTQARNRPEEVITIDIEDSQADDTEAT